MVPQAIKLHRLAKTLELVFSGQSFCLPLEFLRVYCPSNIHTGGSSGALVSGKKHVNVTRIDNIGRYAIRLHFDDGYNSGIYSFDWLYKIASEQPALWDNYLKRLEEANLSRLPVAIKINPAKELSSGVSVS